MKTLIAVLAISLLMTGCAAKRDAVVDPEVAFETRFDRTEDFLRMFEGHWSASEPGEIEALHVVRLPEFKLAYYVEEVHRDGRLRQWVAMPEKDGQYYVARTWRITRPDEFAGAWKDEKKLAEMSMYYLRAAEDCDLAMKWSDGMFRGGTAGGGCSGLMPADTEYVATSASLNDSELHYRVQAFDAQGHRAWGGDEEQRFVKGSF